MRRGKLGWIVAAFAGLAVCSTSHAASTTSGTSTNDGLLTNGIITVDGSLGDWGVTVPGAAADPGDDGNYDFWNSSEGAYVWEDEDSRPGPGVGGQDFDIEALYTGFDASTNTLYVGLVTGFDIGGELGTYYAGDLFIDFGNDYDQTGRAGGLNTPSVNNETEVVYDNTNSSTRWDLAFVLGKDGSYGGNVASAGSTSVDVLGTPSFTYANAPQGNPGFPSGPLSATGGTSYGTAEFAYKDNWGDSGDHNVYEFGFTLTGPQGLAWRNQLLNDGWTAHWTMSCGNDFLDVGTGIPSDTILTPVVPVPAAAPMVLLGMGAVAFARRFRKTHA